MQKLLCFLSLTLLLSGCNQGGGDDDDDDPGAPATISGYITIEGVVPSVNVISGPSLAEAPQAWRQVKILWRADSSPAQRRALCERHGLLGEGVRFGRLTTYLQRASDRILLERRALQEEPLVEEAAIGGMATLSFTPTDDAWSRQWGPVQIGAETAWDTTRGSASVVVAVIDSGIDPNHPEFAGRLVAGYDFVSNNYPPNHAIDGDGPDADPTDSDAAVNGETSHGSHVSGIIAANADGSGIVGLDHTCKIMPIRVFGQGGAGYDTDIWQGLIYAAKLTESDLSGFSWFATYFPNGLDADRPQPAVAADVINMSLGGNSQPFANDLSHQVYDDLLGVIAAKGIITVVAAGNERGWYADPNQGRIVTAHAIKMPAASRHVLAVAATTPTGDYASYSNFGLEVDVAAPGGSVSEGIYSVNYGTTPSGDPAYIALAGTSMATPHVAGVCALLKAVAGNADLELMRQMLADTALDKGTSGFDVDYGHGLVQADAALATAASASLRPALLADHSWLEVASDSTTVSFQLRNPAGSVADLGALTWSASYEEDDASDWVRDIAISDAAVSVTVDPSLMGRAPSTAYLQLAAASGPTLRLSLLVDHSATNGGGAIDTVFVLLIDADSGMTRYQQNLVLPNAAFNFSSVIPGAYQLVAGTDLDFDGEIGDSGEYIGAYGGISAPTRLTFNGGEVINNVQVDLLPAPISVDQ